MLLNAHTINATELNGADPEFLQPEILREINGHELNGSVLNGDQPLIQAGGEGQFEFNGWELNNHEINGGPVLNLAAVANVELTQGTEDGEIIVFEDTAVLSANTEIIQGTEDGEIIVFEETAEVSAGSRIIAPLEIDVFAPTGRVLVFLDQVIYETGQAIVPLEIDVTFNTGTAVVPLEIEVFGTGQAIVTLEQQIFDEDEFAPTGGETLIWRAKVTLDGVDVSDNVTDDISVEAEEGSARIADFRLKPAAGAVTLTDWVGAPVTIDFVALDSSGSVVAETRVFTGIVDVPDYDPITRITSYSCTDNFQQKVEQTARVDLDAFIGGRWSPFIFDEEVDNWQYAQDRLSTVAKSLDLTPFGNLRPATAWEGQATENYLFEESDVFDESIGVELESARNILGSFDIEFNYQFERLRSRQLTFQWRFPGSFCDWLTGRTTIPQKAFIQDAAEGTGWALTFIYFEDLPPSQLVSCGADGLIPWLNFPTPTTRLCFSSNGILEKRFAQAVREKYTLRIQGPASEFSDVRSGRTFNVQSEYDTDGWEDSEFPPTQVNVFRLGGNDDFYEDRDEEEIGNRTDMEEAMNTVIDIGKVNVLDAHRQNRITFDVSLRPQIDLIHTVRIDTTNVEAKGKVSQIVHVMNIETGEATSKVTISVSQASGTPVSETPTAPATKPDTVSQMTGAVRRIGLGTQYGGDAGIGGPEFSLGKSVPDDEDTPFPGWTSNLSPPDPGAPILEERFEIVTDEIEAVDRDEIIGETEQIYNVDIPNETLVLNA